MAKSKKTKAVPLTPEEVVRTFNRNLEMKAEKLYQIRQSIDALKDKYDRATFDLKREKEALQFLLIKEMKAANQKKVESLDSRIPITLKTAKSLQVVDEEMAYQWAIEHSAISINKDKVESEMKAQDIVAPGFAVVESEYISVGKAKDEKKVEKKLKDNEE